MLLGLEIGREGEWDIICALRKAMMETSEYGIKVRNEIEATPRRVPAK